MRLNEGIYGAIKRVAKMMIPTQYDPKTGCQILWEYFFFAIVWNIISTKASRDIGIFSITIKEIEKNFRKN